MANDFIALDITGVEAIQNRLSKLPRAAQDEGVEEADKYIVNVMRMYPQKVAPGTPFIWSSDKQRKFVMAKLRENGFQGRNQKLAKGWKTVGQGYKQIVANETPYADYVQGESQIVGHKARGWKTIEDNLKAKGAEILRHFEAGVKRAIKKVGL